ncbi:MAG: exo-alpha-sialidase [Verrucomicrobiota bacterium JB022]|nr:exo-alpha-sialidase [Verrucomicrobiota bacterium JB022]
MKLPYLVSCFALPLLAGCTATAQPISEIEHPVIFNGDEVANTNADGGLRWAVGTHNIQVYRANRTQPQHQDGLDHTYLHAPMLAYWQDKFLLAYLSGAVNEHDTPTDTSFMTSLDGVNWSAPKLLFPAYQLPDGSWTLTHQRMVWYVAPNGRLLATGFHGEAPNPNDGSGIGRVVREVKANGELGPIYFIRYNSGPNWDEAKAKQYPFYTQSGDAAFKEACEALLNDKLATAQWWEEDRAEDGFYRVKGKAFMTYHRPDGKVVGLAKDAQASISDDEGETWERKGFIPGLEVNGSKYWAQKTDDGKYALVYNPTTRLRHPLAVMLSDDGQNFDQLLSIHGELPVQRWPGLYKNMGPQYVRGISEGNGNPPGNDLWLTYSVNKEDLWVSRTPTPITADAPVPANDEFEQTNINKMPVLWNIYRPVWAPVTVVQADETHGRVLQLVDEDPYDYASATRAFPASRSVKTTFNFKAEQTDARLEIDFTGPNGMRPVQVALTADGKIEARHEGIWKDAGTYQAGEWSELTIWVNPEKNTEKFRILVNGKETLYRDAYFSDYIPQVERMTFRTGEYRRRGAGGHELPGADERAKRAVFQIDDVKFEFPAEQ